MMEVRLPNPVNSMRAAVPVAACVGAASYFIYKSLAKSARSGQYEEVGIVKKIFIYPIKSLPPIEVTEAVVSYEGLNYKKIKDREFVLIDVDNNGKFLTARDEPSLVLLRTHYDGDNVLSLFSNNPNVAMDTLNIELKDAIVHGERRIVETWEPEFRYDALVCKQYISDWFSKYLGKNVQLVKLHHLITPPSNDIPNRFQDEAAVSYLSIASVKTLNDLMTSPDAGTISHRNFRPSILVETKYAFEEDFWRSVRIGDAETRFLNRCYRCVFTTINPDSGVKTNKEPLDTLRKFRVERSPLGVAKYKYRPLIATQHFVQKAGTIYSDQKILAIRGERELI